MIPKIIHYCWFGGSEMPELALKCIASWKQHLADYELILWNEENFDVNSNNYVKEAYESKKYAFVTDYVRLYVLYHHGGIYLDTDVEILKNLDEFLCLPAFSGFESETKVPTGIMASERFGQWAKEQLDYYSQRHFILSDGSYNLTTNVTVISNNMADGGFIFSNTIQNYKDIITMYPNDYFCAKSWVTGEITLTPNTYCIHHFAGSWKEPVSLGRKMKDTFLTMIGDNNGNRLMILKRKIKKLIS